MAKHNESQVLEVVEAMRKNGGSATFGHLYSSLDFSGWKTKTPEASVRRVVQTHPQLFKKILPGLWALEEFREKYQLERFDDVVQDEVTEERKQEFTHSYDQGLVVQIGNMHGEETFVAKNDQSRMFLDKTLKEVSSLADIYKFGSDEIQRRAKNVDVIWFNVNERMPSAFFEVEHSTDIKNSLAKFGDFQSLHANFYIVAREERREQFDTLINRPIFSPLRNRVKFFTYENLVKQHEMMSELASMETIQPAPRIKIL